MIFPKIVSKRIVLMRVLFVGLFTDCHVREIDIWVRHAVTEPSAAFLLETFAVTTSEANHFLNQAIGFIHSENSDAFSMQDLVDQRSPVAAASAGMLYLFPVLGLLVVYIL
jgi:hypothetical protein